MMLRPRTSAGVNWSWAAKNMAKASRKLFEVRDEAQPLDEDAALLPASCTRIARTHHFQSSRPKRNVGNSAWVSKAC